MKGAKGWVLINASPDVCTQIQHLKLDETKDAHSRTSFIEHVFLTNGDLDHVLGVFQLREGRVLNVTAPNGVWNSLISGLRMPQVLSSFLDVNLTPCPFEWTALAGLEVLAVPLTQAGPPPYARNEVGCHGVGYLFREGPESKIVGVFPDVALIDSHLREQLRLCEIAFFDGTFWDEDELIREVGASRTATQMGHVTISGPDGSLNFLQQLGLPTCVYVHINNTNPILRPDSAERQAVESAGLLVGADGMAFTV